jgi:serine/threonine protein kinase
MVPLFREDIFKEIDIQGNLNHENIIHLKEYYEEDNKVRGGNVCVVSVCRSTGRGGTGITHRTKRGSLQI